MVRRVARDDKFGDGAAPLEEGAVDAGRAGVRSPAAPRVTATGFPPARRTCRRGPPFSSVHVDGARTTMGSSPVTSRTLLVGAQRQPTAGPCRRAESDLHGDVATVGAQPSHEEPLGRRGRARRRRSAEHRRRPISFRARGIASDSDARRRSPLRAQGGRANSPPRSPSRIENSSGVEFDARPAEPRDAAVRIDERRGSRIREQRVRADRMLHPVSLEDGRDPCGDRAKRAVARATCPRHLLSRTLVRSLRSGFRPGDGAELKNSLPHFVRSVKDFVGECGRSGKTSSLSP